MPLLGDAPSEIIDGVEALGFHITGAGVAFDDI